MKKELLYIGLVLLFFTSCSQRLIVSTPSQTHILKKDSTLLYLDGESEPFSGRFVKQDKNNLLLSDVSYSKGILHAKFLEYKTINDCTFVVLSCKYNKGKLSGPYTKLA
jgi:antitoxin component YwqK of YwqJK toxin-antitoxin module